MPSYNKVLLMGHLTRDPQLKYLPNQTAVAEFGIAANRKFKAPSGEEREDVLFVDCSAYGRTGEVINQYFTKGKAIFIEGRLKFDSWEDKQGGGKRSKLSVVVENFQFVGGRDGHGDGDGEENDRPPQRSVPQRGSQRTPAGRPPSRQTEPAGEEQQFKEDDIPF